MSFVFNRLRRLGDAGVTSMELAVSFVVFITFIFAMIDLSAYFYSQQALTTLVTIAARQVYATSVTSADSGTPAAQTLIAANGLLLDPSQISLRMDSGYGVPLPNGETTAGGVNVLTVTATYNFVPLTPLLGALIGPMTATVTYQY
jgi:Flp pilus assembly protein TadG